MFGTETGRIAFRPAGAGSAIGPLQNLIEPPTIGEPVVAAIAPSGDALVGTQQGVDTDVRVAFRPAGAASLVDRANAQSFGGGRLIGLALDPDGGAVVVFRDGQATYQAVRETGEPSFEAPVEIQAPGMNSSEYQLQMAAGRGGHALLGWIGSSNVSTNEFEHAMAAYRPPGGAFGAPQIVGSATDDLSVGDVTPAVNDVGDGVLTWTQTTYDGLCSPGDRYDYGARAAFLHGGTIGVPTALGSSSFPALSAVDGTEATGDRIAVVVGDDDKGSGNRCDVSDNTSRLRLRLYRSGGTGPQLEQELTFADSHLSGGLWRHPSLIDMGLSPSGGLLLAYRENQVDYLRAREDASANPGGGGPGPGGDPDPGGGPQPGGDPPPILPIAPRDLVRPRPIAGARPRVTLLCPAGATDECATHIAVRAAFGALPGGSSAEAAATRRSGSKRRGTAKRRAKQRRAKRRRTATLLGRARVRLSPGQARTVRVRLTKAGRKAVRRSRAQRVRMVVTTTIGDRREQFVVRTKLKPAKKKAGTKRMRAGTKRKGAGRR